MSEPLAVWLSACIIYHNLPPIPPPLLGLTEKWNLAKDDSFQVISCSLLCLPSSISSQYQLCLAKQNKPAISFACFGLNINTLFPLPLLLLYFFSFLFLFLFTSSCGELQEGKKSYLHQLFVVLSSPAALRLLFIPVSASLTVPVSFGKRSCSASDSADSLARVGIMWKKNRLLSRLIKMLSAGACGYGNAAFSLLPSNIQLSASSCGCTSIGLEYPKS